MGEIFQHKSWNAGDYRNNHTRNRVRVKKFRPDFTLFEFLLARVSNRCIMSEGGGKNAAVRKEDSYFPQECLSLTEHHRNRPSKRAAIVSSRPQAGEFRGRQTEEVSEKPELGATERKRPFTWSCPWDGKRYGRISERPVGSAATATAL